MAGFMSGFAQGFQHERDKDFKAKEAAKEREAAEKRLRVQYQMDFSNKVKLAKAEQDIIRSREQEKIIQFVRGSGIDPESEEGIQRINLIGSVGIDNFTKRQHELTLKKAEHERKAQERKTVTKDDVTYTVDTFGNRYLPEDPNTPMSEKIFEERRNNARNRKLAKDKLEAINDANKSVSTTFEKEKDTLVETAGNFLLNADDIIEAVMLAPDQLQAGGVQTLDKVVAALGLEINSDRQNASRYLEDVQSQLTLVATQILKGSISEKEIELTGQQSIHPTDSREYKKYKVEELKANSLRILALQDRASVLERNSRETGNPLFFDEAWKIAEDEFKANRPYRSELRTKEGLPIRFDIFENDYKKTFPNADPGDVLSAWSELNAALEREQGAR